MQMLLPHLKGGTHLRGAILRKESPHLRGDIHPRVTLLRDILLSKEATLRLLTPHQFQWPNLRPRSFPQALTFPSDYMSWYVCVFLCTCASIQ